VVWFGVNFIFDRFLGLPRYRYTIPRGYDYQEKRANLAGDEVSALNGNIQSPGFLARIPQRISLDELLAIKAEQHYLRVFTPDREHMVLYRFGDAVNELDNDLGIQVHRSYWVNKNAIDCIKPKAKKFLLRLKGGIDIPVSIPYHNAVKELARSIGVPSRP
jgi:DNA-binding LytR/AlgR family response regulator